jgi:serine O-acetyltransferase
VTQTIVDEPRRGDAPHRKINRWLALGRLFTVRGFKPLSRLLDIFVRLVFAADIPSRMPIPDAVTFYHNGLATVVDEAVVFEGSAILMQGVTLGFSLVGRPGVPTIGRRVLIGAGATVVGGVRIGDDCIIGAGAVVTHDVPSGHKVICTAAIDRDNDITPDWLSFWNG